MRLIAATRSASWASPALRALWIAGRALWFYPGTLLWPRALTFIYPRWDVDPRVWCQYLFPIAAFVLSPAAYNAKTGLMLCCPITSQVKGYPFEVVVAGTAKVRGVILADQVKSLDWQVRRAEKVGKVPKPVLEEVLDKVRAILEG